jgi:predicted small metal-binding protein
MVLLKHLLFLSLLYSSSCAIEITNLHHAVDVAGKQRMFTQRMLKDYAMIGMENNFNNPGKDLKDIIAKFENHLESLHKYTKKKEIKESTNKVKKLWLPIKKILEESPKKEKALQLQESLEHLLKASDTTTHLFAKETGEQAGIIIDMSGRQRMLSQRMASLYMLKVWGVKNKNFQHKMDSSMKLFETSLTELKNSKLNTSEINHLLKEVEKSFTFFKIMNKTSNTFIPTLIYKKSNDILRNMNTITHNYASLKRK